MRKGSHRRRSLPFHRFLPGRIRYFTRTYPAQRPMAITDAWTVVFIVAASLLSLLTLFIIHLVGGEFELVAVSTIHIALLGGAVVCALRGRWDCAIAVAGIVAFVFNSSWLVYNHVAELSASIPFGLDTYFYLQPLYLILVGLLAKSRRPIIVLSVIAFGFTVAVTWIDQPRSDMVEALGLAVPIFYGIPVAVGLLLNGAHAFLEGMIAQQNALLREGHHRIKNNLHILSANVSLRNENQTPAEFKQDILSRINAMATLEEHIYRSPAFGEIPLREFVEQIVLGIQNAANGDTRNPRFRLEVDAVSVPITYGPKIGILLVEMITNAYKHAFHETDDPEISITVANRDNSMTIDYRDNGCGVSEEWTPASGSTGFQLIDGIVRDLDGTLTVTSDPGLHLVLTFPVSGEHREGRSLQPKV